MFKFQGTEQIHLVRIFTGYRFLHYVSVAAFCENLAFLKISIRIRYLFTISVKLKGIIIISLFSKKRALALKHAHP